MNSVCTAIWEVRDLLVAAMLAWASSWAFLALASPSWIARARALFKSENMPLRWTWMALRSAADAFFQSLATPVILFRRFLNFWALVMTTLVRVVMRDVNCFLAAASWLAVAALV